MWITEPYYITCIKDGPFQRKTAEGANKPEAQWTNDDMRVVNQDQRLKSVIIACLPDDIMEAKPSESLSQTYTRYKTLFNELSNDGVKLSKHEINVAFVNSLPEKWLSFSQGLKNVKADTFLDKVLSWLLVDGYLEVEALLRNVIIDEQQVAHRFVVDDKVAVEEQLTLVDCTVMDDLHKMVVDHKRL
ncbi:hypothetical protein Tco_0757526 [Tanacetum coccineum]